MKSKWLRIKWNQACAELANKPFENLFADTDIPLPIRRERNPYAPVYNYWRGNEWIGKIEKYRQSSGSATTWKITGKTGIIGENDTLKGAEQNLFASA